MCTGVVNSPMSTKTHTSIPSCFTETNHGKRVCACVYGASEPGDGSFGVHRPTTAPLERDPGRIDEPAACDAESPFGPFAVCASCGCIGFHTRGKPSDSPLEIHQAEPDPTRRLALSLRSLMCVCVFLGWLKRDAKKHPFCWGANVKARPTEKHNHPPAANSEGLP